MLKKALAIYKKKLVEQLAERVSSGKTFQMTMECRLGCRMHVKLGRGALFPQETRGIF